MTATDPRVLIQALEDLDEELGRWSAQARNALASGQYDYVQGRELAERLTHRAAVVSHQADEDRQTVDTAEGELARLSERCQQGLSVAEAALQAANAALSHAVQTHNRWTAELDKAQRWLARAEERLRVALAAEAQAMAALQHAESNRSWAYSRLRSCQNDKNRRNCSGEESDVRHAEAEVQRAAAEYQIAHAERLDAEAEVAAARARVACCTAAVGAASAAVALGKQAREAGELGLAAAERSAELVRAAERWLQEARQHLDEQTEAAEDAVTGAFKASAAADDAYYHLLTGERAGDRAQQLCSDVRRELDARTYELRQFNAPTLDDFVGRA